METLTLVEKIVVFDAKRCIGCGLCVSTCPTGTLALVRKPSSEQKEVPKTLRDTYYKLRRARGKLGAGTIISQVMRSAKDRVLSSK
jgi:Fe-S-cluster-containing hydrogenase component 2